MKSGLVYFKGKTIQESIVKYCHDYGVDLLVLAPGVQRNLPRLSTSISEGCSRNVDCDFLIWKDQEGKTEPQKGKSSRRLSLDGSLPRPRGKPRRFSMGADVEEEQVDGPPEEVSYVFGYDTPRTLSP